MTDAGESIGCVGDDTGDRRADAFLIDFFAGTRSLAVDIVDDVLTLSSTAGSLATGTSWGSECGALQLNDFGVSCTDAQADRPEIVLVDGS